MRLLAILAAALIAAVPIAASAHPHHHHVYSTHHHFHHFHRRAGVRDFTPDPLGFGFEAGPIGLQAGVRGFGFHVGPVAAGLSTHGIIVGHRPNGCPYEYCGCEASLTVFGRVIGRLNLAANWLHFPHTAPAPGMAAVAPSRHHVLVLKRHVRGTWWLVHDGNSGHHITRDHIRNIAGFTVVNPYA